MPAVTIVSFVEVKLLPIGAAVIPNQTRSCQLSQFPLVSKLPEIRGGAGKNKIPGGI